MQSRSERKNVARVARQNFKISISDDLWVWASAKELVWALEWVSAPAWVSLLVSEWASGSASNSFQDSSSVRCRRRRDMARLHLFSLTCARRGARDPCLISTDTLHGPAPPRPQRLAPPSMFRSTYRTDLSALYSEWLLQAPPPESMNHDLKTKRACHWQ